MACPLSLLSCGSYPLRTGPTALQCVLAPARAIGGILILIGILFTAVDGFLIVTALATHTPVDATTHTSWIADFTIQLPALLLGGILLWRLRASSCRAPWSMPATLS
jgi:hypothetical protein